MITTVSSPSCSFKLIILIKSQVVYCWSYTSYVADVERGQVTLYLEGQNIVGKGKTVVL